MKNNRIIIFDTTLRDGEQCPGASMNLREKLEVARQLARALADSATPPSHLQFLNQIARAAGYRNLQALQAGAPQAVPAMAADASPSDAAPVDAAPSPLSDTARRALLQFDTAGRLQRWPAKYSVQRLILWPLWARFEPRRRYTEAEVNTVLKAANTFGDHVTLRRELVNHQLLARKPDCSQYWKLPARPDPEVRALLAAWRARHARRPTITRPASAERIPIPPAGRAGGVA